jgi:hypothetical protein
MNGATSLGVVSWFASWRKYTFSPIAGTTFDQGCLAEIADFLQTETQCHKAKV